MGRSAPPASRPLGSPGRQSDAGLANPLPALRTCMQTLPPLCIVLFAAWTLPAKRVLRSLPPRPMDPQCTLLPSAFVIAAPPSSGFAAAPLSAGGGPPVARNGQPFARLVISTRHISPPKFFRVACVAGPAHVRPIFVATSLGNAVIVGTSTLPGAGPRRVLHILALPGAPHVCPIQRWVLAGAGLSLFLRL